MSSIRVKLIFERPLVKSPEQCWMLVDKNSCKMIRDLEYLIVKKFFVAGHTILNLYLDDFLLPSHEKIELIRDNDIIRVIEDKNFVLSNKKPGDSNSKQRNETSKKRKYEESSDSKRKKAKHSLNNELTAENKLNSSITDKQLSANVVVENDLKTIEKSAVTNSQKEKPKKNKNSKVDPNAKTKQKKLKKKQSSKDKSIVTRLNDFLGKVGGSRNQLNPTLSPKKSNGLDNVTTEPEEKDNGTVLSETSADNEKAEELTLRSKVQENNKLQQLLSKGGSDKEMSDRNQNGTPQRSQGNHIRFENEENDLSTDAVQPITHPQILSLRQTNAPCPSGTPNLSPIEPNTQSCFASKKSVNGPNGKLNNQRGGRGGKRKDTYTNRSHILESTRVDKDNQPQDLQSTTSQSAKKDFSVYSLLHGPPRVGDTVAFKMIEMSQSYTPEISKYKEGQVISFDPISKHFTLKLTKESLERVTGDGRVSSKFEIFENSEDDGQTIGTEEMSDEIQIQWLSMLEPRLVHS